MGSPQSVVPEVLNAAMPLLVKLRGYPTENRRSTYYSQELLPEEKLRGGVLSLHGHDRLIQGLHCRTVGTHWINGNGPWG